MSEDGVNLNESLVKDNGGSQPVPRPITAFIGHYSSFGAYLGFYAHAVNLLFTAVENGQEPIDMIASPLLFMMRHTMELGYKYTLWELHRMNGDTYDVRTYKNHKLSFLHAALAAQYAKVVAKYDLPDTEVNEFNSYFKTTETGMKCFESLDETSFNFRYPVNTKGVVNFQLGQTVDLRATKLLFDNAMVVLEYTIDVLEPYTEYRRWLDEQMDSNWY